MTEYRFEGRVPTSYVHHLHHEKDGVLTVDPDEIVDFGDRLPPLDGEWSAEQPDGSWKRVWPELPAEPAEETAPEGSGTGAGSAEDLHGNELD